MDLTTLTALELGAAIRRGEVLPEEAVQAGLDTIAAQGQNSFITLTGAQALEGARQIRKHCRGKRNHHSRWRISTRRGKAEGAGDVRSVPMGRQE